MDNLVKVSRINSLVEEELEFLINDQKVVAFNVSYQAS
ncbi:hypothetical protein MFLO_14803 [Listeria floridensis FSL S10-1187]|uniref:Uncharacterized protein n=1 Tax=Listeria floridensis FSL S10-1187 TaxID=1265817 RepID=A0ABP3AU54_9LIST|nr:hypothetical protein MFLO_14803 [Listeria floridensis FSL S10-1187]